MISDAERERAVRTLRELYVSGALTLDELNERLEGVFAARSSAELRDRMPSEELLRDPLTVAVATGVSPSDLDIIDRHLSPGEKVYWVGHPDPRVRFVRADFFLLPFTALWATFAVTWAALVFGSGAPALFDIAGVAFALIGIYLVAGRFLFAARRRRRTLYAVTSRRVMRVIRRRRGAAIRGLYLTAIPSIAVSQQSRTRGSVLFGDAPRYEVDLPWFMQGNDAPTGMGFHYLDDPQAIADLAERLRDQREDTKESTAPLT
jgi:hypothetical protein